MAVEDFFPPSRVFIAQDGSFHTNAGGFFNDDETDISAQLNVLDSVVAAELIFLDGAIAGTAVASKCLVLDGSKGVTTITSATITTLTSTTIDTTTLTSAALVLESLAPMTIKLNDTNALSLDNAAISGFAAATDTVGLDVFIETQDAGATPTASRVGGKLDIKTGAGAAALTTIAAGPGGAFIVTSGEGGVQSGAGASGVGGAGGAVSLIGNVGGITNNTGTDAAGAGGPASLTGGAGGAASGAGASDGGAGGDVTITPGAGGTSANGVAGVPGKAKIAAGNLHFTNAQTLDMSDAQVALTLVPGTPTGTLITSNVMYIDPNSAGGTEDLLLPPEADANGLTLYIANTAGGAEDIVVKEDGDSTTIMTISQDQIGIAFCDGTTWRGGIMAIT